MLTDLRAIHQFTVHLSEVDEHLNPIRIGRSLSCITALAVRHHEIGGAPLKKAFFARKNAPESCLKLNLTIFELKKCPKITESTQCI